MVQYFNRLKRRNCVKNTVSNYITKKKDYLYKYNISFISFCFNGLFNKPYEDFSSIF